MAILTFPEAVVPPALRAQVVDLQRRAWPPDDATRGPGGTLTHDPALHPRSMLLVEDGRVLW